MRVRHEHLARANLIGLKTGVVHAAIDALVHALAEGVDLRPQGGRVVIWRRRSAAGST